MVREVDDLAIRYAAIPYDRLLSFDNKLRYQIVDQLCDLARAEIMARSPNLAALREPCDPEYLREVYGDWEADAELAS
jgi:hypothetical protein